MIRTILQNETLLKQLNQEVESNSTNTINLTRKLIQAETVQGVDSIPKKDSISQSVTQKSLQSLPKKRVKNPDTRQTEVMLMDSVKPIRMDQIKVFTEKSQQPGIELPERAMPREKPDWFLGIFILVLVLLASVRLFFNKYLHQIFHAIVNYATSSRLFRERSLSITHASFRLDLIFYFVFSIFVYQLLEEFRISFEQVGFITYLTILGMVIGYFILKRFVYFFTGIVSENTSETSEFLYNINLHNRILGLFLIPVTLLIAFSSLGNLRLVVLSGIAICGIFYLLLLIRGSKILMTKHFSIFYLILYLCTLEILPLIFIYNMVLVNNGIK